MRPTGRLVLSGVVTRRTGNTTFHECGDPYIFDWHLPSSIGYSRHNVRRFYANHYHTQRTGQENYGGTLTDPNGSDDNISADPILVETSSWDGNGTENQTDDLWINGNYRLGWFSPCRDAGAHNNLTPPQDILKTIRPAFSGVDIGAYELQIRD